MIEEDERNKTEDGSSTRVNREAMRRRMTDEGDAVPRIETHESDEQKKARTKRQLERQQRQEQQQRQRMNNQNDGDQMSLDG
jgi:hypothetical protein